MLAGIRTNVNPTVSRFVEREKIRPYAAIVLSAGARGDEPVGLMFVNHRSPNNFSVEDKRVFATLASSAAIAIHAARLHEEGQKSLIGRLLRQKSVPSKRSLR